MEESMESPSSQDVLKELLSIGLSRASDCLQMVDGKVELNPEVLQGQMGAAIVSMECTDKGWKLKFCDKLKALQMLGEHLGLFRERSAAQEEGCNLLEAILDTTKEDLDCSDLSELQ